MFSVNTFPLLFPWFWYIDLFIVIAFQQSAETIAEGRGVLISVVGQDNISLLRTACLQGPKPVFLTHLQGIKSEECTLNLHSFLALWRTTDGLSMEHNQDLQAPHLSVFNVWLYHLAFGSFSCFSAQTVHSGRIHNALKPKTFHRVMVGLTRGPDKGSCEDRENKHYTTSKLTLGPLLCTFVISTRSHQKVNPIPISGL